MKRKIILCVSMLTIVSGLLSYGIFKASAAKDSVSKVKSIVGTENGEIVRDGVRKIKGVSNLGKNEENNADYSQIEMHDNKYSYRLNVDTYDIESFMIKSDNYNQYCNVSGNISQDDAVSKAKQYIKKYAPDVSNLILDDVKHKIDSVENFYIVTHSEVASNGVKTDGSISAWINQSGDLITFIKVKGNTSAALKEPKISKKAAEEIAYNKVKTSNIETQTKSELVGWKDKLVYDVKIEPVRKVGFYTVYSVKVDAETGDILYFDKTV